MNPLGTVAPFPFTAVTWLMSAFEPYTGGAGILSLAYSWRNWGPWPVVQVGVEPRSWDSLSHSPSTSPPCALQQRSSPWLCCAPQRSLASRWKGQLSCPAAWGSPKRLPFLPQNLGPGLPHRWSPAHALFFCLSPQCSTPARPVQPQPLGHQGGVAAPAPQPEQWAGGEIQDRVRFGKGR